MVVKLPMEKSPIIKTYNTRSFPLGILQAQGDKTWPWIYNKFINCVYFPYQERKFDICMEDWWFTRSQVFSVQLLRLTPEYLSFNSINIISIIQECIDNGKYIYGFLNERYIPAKPNYLKSDFNHEYLIYGYDSDKQFIGYTSSGRYEEYSVPYADYIKSIECKKEFDICMVTPNHNFEFALNLQEIVGDIEEYLKSINTHEENKTKLYGLQCWKIFLENLNQTMQEGYIDLRHTRLFLEHKTLMYNRLKYLSEQGYVGSVHAYEDIFNSANLAYKLSMKFRIAPGAPLASKISALYQEIIDQEAIALSRFLVELKVFLQNKQ